MPPREHLTGDRTNLDQAEELLSELQHATSPETRQELSDRIVRLTLGLADSLARTYRFRGIGTEDLTQVARLGLMKAIRRYHPDYGRGFAAFAVPTIVGEVKRHFRDQGWLVRPPRAVQELRARLVMEEEALRRSLGRGPTDGELAERLGAERKTVAEVRLASRGFAAEPLISHDERWRSIDPPAPGDPYQEFADWDAVCQGLRCLSSRQRRVLRLRYVEDLTQAEIGAEVGLSQMQVSRILAKSLNQLRHLAEAS